MDLIILSWTAHLKREYENKAMEQTNWKNERENPKVGNDVAEHGRQDNFS